MILSSWGIDCTEKPDYNWLFRITDNYVQNHYFCHINSQGFFFPVHLFCSENRKNLPLNPLHDQSISQENLDINLFRIMMIESTILVLSFILFDWRKIISFQSICIYEVHTHQMFVFENKTDLV